MKPVVHVPRYQVPPWILSGGAVPSGSAMAARSVEVVVIWLPTEVHSLPVVLAFAATASRPAAVLTGPTAIVEIPPGVIRLPRPVCIGDMTRVSIAGHPLTATAALVWNGDLPRPLQQILFDTADSVTTAPGSSPPAADRCGLYAAELISEGTPALTGSWN